MEFQIFGKETAPTLMLIPGLGVSYEIFMPLVHLLEERFRIVAVEVDGFTLGKQTRFTSVDDQAAQVIAYVQKLYGGHLDCAYGLSLGGKILSRVLERNEITIDHAILDAAPLLPLPRWLVGPLRHYQAFNVWTCYRWTSFWSWVFHSHYFDVLLDECKKAYPFGGRQAVLDGYKSVYTNKLERISGKDIHFWYGTKEAFAAKPQAKHLLALCPEAHIQVFKSMNHGQLLVDHPEEVAGRIIKMINMCYREEAIECVKDHILQIHKQIYAKYNGDFDRIYTEGYNSKSYTGRVIEPGKVYELSYLECTCPKVKCGLRNHPQQCECSRQSILYILSQLEPDSQFEVRIENTILRGSDRCTFRITRHEDTKRTV